MSPNVQRVLFLSQNKLDLVIRFDKIASGVTKGAIVLCCAFVALANLRYINALNNNNNCPQSRAKEESGEKA